MEIDADSNRNRFVKHLLRALLTRSPASCLGCRYLYSEGIGFADDDRIATRLDCALDASAHLPCQVPARTDVRSIADRKPACDAYRAGRMIHLDVAGRDGPGMYSLDETQVRIIAQHARRRPHGDTNAWARLNSRQDW